MDEFLQGINASIYLKWILMQNNHYSLNIKVDDNDNNTIIISNEIVIGKIIYYGKGIFEEELNDRQTKEKIFYLHFQLTHFNHAVELFKEMINCALEATNRPQIRVLLCCSGGLTTTLFASKMQELAKLENLSYEIFATGYSRLFEIANDYDIILIDVYKRQGVVRTTYLINEEGIIEKAFTKVKAADDAERMLREIESE